MELKKEELLEIKGGFGFGGWVLGGAIFTFVIGVLDGYVRPSRCN